MIEVKSEIETIKFTEQQGMKSKIKITGEGKSSIFFDIEEGIIVESKGKASLEGEQEISGTMFPEPISVPIYIDEDTYITLIK